MPLVCGCVYSLVPTNIYSINDDVGIIIILIIIIITHIYVETNIKIIMKTKHVVVVVPG